MIDFNTILICVDGALKRKYLKMKLPFTEPISNHFIDGMKKIFELEPFIKTAWNEGMKAPEEPLRLVMGAV